MNDAPYHLKQKSIRGLWELKGRKVIAFSATSSVPYERFVNNCIDKPTVLKFKSEYELIHGVSPVADPTVIACADQ